MKILCIATILGSILRMASACGKHIAADDNVSTPSAAGYVVWPVQEYAKAIGGADTTAVLIDVRTPEEYAQGHIKGARLLNVNEEQAFVTAVDSLDARYTYYIYCRSGRRSQRAGNIMQERGLKVVDLQGGYNAWVEEKGKR